MTTAEAPAASIEGTVLFTDIVGFTEFNAIRGDAEAVRLLTMQEDAVREELPGGARLVKEIGDGLLLWFPNSVAAIDTALRLQRRFASISKSPATPLWVRMGAHWGRQTPRYEDIVGHDVNLASRVMEVAGPGEIIVSDATRANARNSGFAGEFEEIGPVLMKGIPDPVRIFRVVGEDW